MNYYEHHIGDYIKATAHLSMLEDAAYRRLIDAYYTKEIPLPSDRKACHRLARATSKPERDAVDTILDEFFTLRDDGWHQSRCDAELSKYSEKRPAAEGKRENDKERQRRSRERRKHLFEELSSMGINMPWNATTEMLQAELSRVTSSNKSQPVTEPVTRDNTCTQTPVPRHQSPDVNPGSTDSTVNSTTDARAPEVQPAMLSKALRECGIEAQSADPRLIALANRGVKPEALQAAAAEAKQAKPGERIPAGYVIAIVDRWTSEAESIGSSSRSPPPRAGPSSREEGREQASRILTGRGKKDHGNERDITGEAVRIA